MRRRPSSPPAPHTPCLTLPALFYPPTHGPVKCFADAAKSDTDKFARWHRGMLERGVYLAPSQYEAGFMSLAHTDEDIEKTIAAAKEVFAEI